MISFNGIPVAIRTPGQYIEIDNTGAVSGLPGVQHKILVIGQRLAAGTVAADIPTRVNSASEAEEYFGRGSMLYGMFAALKKANQFTEAWAVALDDDGAGVVATGTLTVTGPATADGTLYVYIGGERIKVAVANADADADIATAIAAAINAKTNLPVTAGAALALVTLTARNLGEAANDIDIRLNYFQGESLPAGVGVVVVAMSAGATNPDVATAITAIGDTQYHTVIMPYTDASNLTALETELDRRWGPLTQIEGHAFAAADGTHAALSTLGDSRNNPHVSIMGAQGSPTPPYVIAAIVGGVDAFEPDPARPRQTLKLTGVMAPAEVDRYTQAERNIHLFDGLSTFMAGPGDVVQIERLITSYQLNPLGAEDISYLDVTTLRTVAYIRYTVRLRIALKYPRHKLANDGTQFGPGQAIVTPKDIRDELIALFGDWEDSGLAEGREQFKRDLIVERNAGDPNRVDAVIPPDVVNQFRVFAASVKFLL